MMRVGKRFLVGAVIAATAMTVEPAHAEPYVVGVPEVWIDKNGTVGLGATAIGGWGLDFDPLLIGPQIAAGAHVRSGGHPAIALAPGDSWDDAGNFMFRLTGGLSVGFAGPVEVALYGRAGPGTAGARDLETTGGVAIDAGLSVDYRVSRDVTIGGQAGYAGLIPIGGQVGGHDAVSFGPRIAYWF
jgi:hypothetical protein